MRSKAPFRREDLDELDAEFLAKADRVVPLADVAAGDRAPNVIGLRHDCDAGHSLATAVKMARWEHDRGYRSTYYLLHTSPYWTAPEFPDLVERIALFGHEIGIHVNALAEALRTGEHPDLILERALKRLRGFGHDVRGAAGHGDRLCTFHAGDGEPWFANDEQFTECLRTKVGGVETGGPGRMLWRGDSSLTLTPRPLADFGLEYEALFCALPFHFRFSDSGGRWTGRGWDETAAVFAEQVTVTDLPTETDDPRQLHLLVHPDWWSNAFVPVRQAA
jgi:hypothetical protein